MELLSLRSDIDRREVGEDDDEDGDEEVGDEVVFADEKLGWGDFVCFGRWVLVFCFEVEGEG